MKHYLYLVLNNKTCISRYVMNHCAILDVDSMQCYHLTNDFGYIREPFCHVAERYDVIDAYPFSREDSIENYMQDCQSRLVGYDIITNNCEDFANGFAGTEVVTQERMYAVFGILTLLLLI